uniref:Retrovirus-related Pol polyprotein from transposon 17.6 n=1 Tax=Cajanus cajan TaxID=3821 RepID=A0A151SGN7_CAJCA|nr:hypothetical protein KK1_000157 [Cajanus cajan]
MQSSLLDHWKSLPLDKYDGTTDPDEHVDIFLTQVTLSTIDDAALCRIFLTSLKGRALSWFTRLPANSIDSFNTPASQFTIQFATSRPHQLTSLALDERVEPIEDRQPIVIVPTDLHVTYLGSNLSETEKHEIGQVVRKNKDLFAWRLTDMPEVILYLEVSGEAISAGMIQEQDGQQQPVYFISRVLQDVERRYQLLEKVALGLIYAARRLRKYFQSHIVVVRTDCPIAKVLRKLELAGRMMAWSIGLSDLADFINELSPRGHFEDNTWTMRVDGSSNGQGSGVGIILESPSSITLEQSMCFGFQASNNQVEYEALLVGMRLAAEIGARKVHFHEESNDGVIRAELDVLDEVREKAQIVAEACKQRMTRRVNSKLKRRNFQEGDLVWRATGSARRNPIEGKLAANWDGPLRVRHALNNGAYKLEELSGKVIPRTWNSTHLKTYYS